jgi:hypothetical protein
MPKKTHGMGTTAEYHIWYGMLDRCRNPNSISWKHYGGRGIAVCDRWLRFEEFICDMGKRPDPKMSLDRIDGDKGYEPGNCRWAAEIEQQRNRRGVKCNPEMAQMVRDGAVRGMSQGELANMAGLDRSGISRILSGESWK